MKCFDLIKIVTDLITLGLFIGELIEVLFKL